MKLYIEFTKSTKKFALFSRLIQIVQRTNYSHVRLRWTNTTNTPITYEASGSSVKFIGPIAQKQIKSKVVHSFEFELNKEQYRHLVRTCMEYAGIKYSILQVISIGLLNLGICKRPLFKDLEHAQVCSELVIRVLRALKFHINLDPDTAGPKELYEVIRDYEELIKWRNTQT